MRRGPLRRLRRRLVLGIIIYGLAGAASQKLVPGVVEIFPFYGWSLFTRVPNESTRYTIRIIERNGRPIDSAPLFLEAPPALVRGNRFIGRKVIQSLGKAHDRGETAETDRLRNLLERNYLRGRVRYELIRERYRPLERWETGEVEERATLITFVRELSP